MEWKDPKRTSNYSNISHTGLGLLFSYFLWDRMVLSAYHSGYMWPGVVGTHGDTDVLFPQASFRPVELINSIFMCICVRACLANSGGLDWACYIKLSWREMAGKICSLLSLGQGQELAFLCIFSPLVGVEIAVAAPHEKSFIRQAQERRVKPCQGKVSLSKSVHYLFSLYKQHYIGKKERQIII